MREDLQSAVQNYFEGAGVPVPQADGAGVRRFALGGVALRLVTSEAAQDDVCLEACVGSFAGVADKATFLEDALRANFFWLGTRGGTFGVSGDGDSLVMSDRRDADDLCAGGAFAAWLEGFARTVREWRQYIADLTPAEGKAVRA